MAAVAAAARFPSTYLLVGCCNDELTHKYKGKTVLTEAERYESLRHCRWVDEVVPDAPWVIDEAFLARHRIDYVTHDALPPSLLLVPRPARYADASGSSNDVYAYVKKVGKFRETQRTEGVSTSDLIVHILRGYNEYVMRNLARGYTRKDLGVSYVKAQQLQLNLGIRKLQERVEQNRQSLGRNLNTVAERVGMNFQTDWVENADRWVTGFLELFEEGFHYMASAPKRSARMPARCRSQHTRDNGSPAGRLTALVDRLRQCG
eukprot:SM000014S00337  [mRNA]  locus=s14:737453:739096:- [translate_table: standard]